ncbi:TolC family protein [Mucilaginibacter pallidiroseus]|uniref:TolC family protein n=1 Tax=Mucilaginibacter pallidiroseus TaxID=2599295 RepID=A0A563TYF3_9SPHI|nr:TolC family protein [Mucilaginibacter pallidiroseus]TWR24398.1 TolC family protein [Mucilaginibacter pallidiroseus]
MIRSVWIWPISYRLLWILAGSLFLRFDRANAQQPSTLTVGRKLSLTEAITLGKTDNSLVKAAQQEEEASRADLDDAKMNALPVVVASSGYQRFTRLTLFESGLSGAHSVPKRPSQYGADAGLTASFNLYSGGKQRALTAEQGHKKDLAGINAQEQSAATAFQIAAQYLDMVRLNDQRRFIIEQVVRAETRLKNISSLFRNQKVTRSDLLRAELNLSAVKLNLEQTDNDITISNQKLNVLINIPDTVKIEPADSSNVAGPTLNELNDLLYQTDVNAFSVRKAEENLLILEDRLKGIRSNGLPSLSLLSAYSINYPNTIFYPPVDQAYAIGFVGVRVQYNISSVYQNKNKVAAARIRVRQLRLVQQNVTDNVRQEAEGMLIKYREALNRISVTERSIDQAMVNYRIVNAKYLNQLALLTDLLDADSLYQETRYNLVQARINARLIYYRMLYTAGKL